MDEEIPTSILHRNFTVISFPYKQLPYIDNLFDNPKYMVIIRIMKRTVLLALLVLATGCGARNHILFASSNVVLACDWGQTRSHATAGWNGTQEMNPIMGTNPTPGRVDAMFATSAAVNTALFAALPERWAWVVPAVLTAAHSVAVVSNFDVAGVCGI